MVGSRPGEKLHEELWSHGAQVVASAFPGVLAVPCDPVPEDFEVALRALEEAALAHQEDTVLQKLEAFQVGVAKRESAFPAA